MGYTVGNGDEVIDDNADMTLRTLTVSVNTDEDTYLEIGGPPGFSPTVGETNAFAGVYSPNLAEGSNIEKFPYSISSGGSTLIGNFSVIRRQMGSTHTDNSNGFFAGGRTNYPTPVSSTGIEKFPYSSGNVNSTDVGDLIIADQYLSGNSSETHGFSHGSNDPTNPGAGQLYYNIDKFPFAISSGTATDVGNLTPILLDAGGHSSLTDGHISGGHLPFVPTPYDVFNVTKKFPFAISGATVTTHGSLGARMKFHGAHTSADDGFTSGGYGSHPGAPSFSNPVGTIYKFPFANSTPVSSTPIGTWPGGYNQGTNSSTTTGFIYGYTGPSTVITSFPFAQTSGAASSTGGSIGVSPGSTIDYGAAGVDD